ncbi:hypothetical protein MBLNU230_g3098t1 [Neophaeotheca triangularis]
MLSRSNSNAAERLRRAKSTSSAYSNASGHQRSCTTIDPFITRRDAEVAALEAYHRARQNEQSAYQDPRPVPPKLQRRRSQATRRSEGSHFEDARLGHRTSLKRKDSKAKTRPAQRQERQEKSRHSAVEPAEKGDGRIVTKKRSVIPPASSSGFKPQQDQLAATARPSIRRSQASYTDGSPTPRYASSLQQHSSTLQLDTQRRARDDGYGGNLEQLSDFGSANDPSRSEALTQLPDRTLQRDEDAIAAARDQCLRDFNAKKLNKRKSFLKLTFPKKRATTIHQNSTSSYDSGLPPFNFAGDGTAPSPPPPPEPPFPPPAVPVTKAKSRVFSDSFKGRFKNVFRKASRSSSGHPAQHLEAMNYHRTLLDRSPPVGFGSTEEPGGEAFTSFDMTHRNGADRTTSPNVEVVTKDQGNTDDDDDETAKSRVTSWTTSTAAGTLNGRNPEIDREGASATGKLQRSGSMSTLKRQTSSLFGRAMHNPLRRPSRQALQSSEESEKLFSALQRRINVPSSPEDTSLNVLVNGSPAPKSFPAISTLPSQQRQPMGMSGALQRAASTIRSVSPDPNAYKLDVMSPVTEAMSPANEYQPRASPGEQRPTGPPIFGSSTRRQGTSARYSKSQLAQRLERTKNRWQSPLDEISPHPMRSATIYDNPYEMRSLSRNLLNESQPPRGNDLPHHARVGENPRMNREAVVSPSVYSQATNAAPSRPDTPGSMGGTVITITGREIKRYSISPQKQPEHAEDRPIHASGDWRKWLSEEMLFPDSPAPDGFSLPSDIERRPNRGSSTQEPSSDPADDASRRPSKSSAPTQDKGRRTSSSKPPTVRSRRSSSYMNERYPMVDSSRNSSNQILQAACPTVIAVDPPANLNEQPTIKVTPSTPSVSGKPVGCRKEEDQHTSIAKPIAKHHSMAQMRTKDPLPAQTLAVRDKLQTSSEDNAMVNAAVISSYAADPDPTNRQPTKPNRPKSAFDLRANYKNSLTRTSRPLEVRRKAQTTTAEPSTEFLDDSTVLEITAGPYASPLAQASNKENHQPQQQSSDDALPSLSSSEWLGGGPRSKRDLGKIDSAVGVPLRSTRHSPSRSTTYYSAESGGGGKGSPGQQMASRFLSGRASKEGTPAFV